MNPTQGKYIPWVGRRSNCCIHTCEGTPGWVGGVTIVYTHVKVPLGG